MSTGRPIVEIVADGAPGGGTTAVLGLCEDLIRTQDRPICLVTQVNSYAATTARNLGIAVEELEFFRSRLDPALPTRLQHVVEKLNPVLVHAHGGRAANPLCGGRFLQREFRLVYTVHGYHFVRKQPLVRSLFRLAEQRIAAAVDHVVFVSKGDRAVALTNGLMKPDTQWSIVPNGVDAQQLGPNTAVTPTNDLILYGRLHHQKNPKLAIEMMEHLLDLDLKMTIVGGGEMEGVLRAMVDNRGLASRISFTGALPREQALQELRRSRVMIFPSLWEGMPLAPVEALYFGVPVIASDIPGTDEVICNERNGILVKSTTPQAFAHAAAGLLNNAERWSRLSSAGRIDAVAKFSRTASSKRYLALYTDLLSGGQV